MELVSGSAGAGNGETLYVDGKWAGASSGAVFDVTDPATGEVIGQAAAAGCTVILKPAEQTPLCAVEMFRVFDEAGFPPGVVNLLTTSHPAQASAPLLDSPAVRKLTFTGSTQTGMMLAARAAATMKR